MNRPEMRYRVSFSVYLTWQDKGGNIRSSPGKCVDLSASGAQIETDYPLAPLTVLTVQSDSFGGRDTPPSDTVSAGL